jgi:hypothetical protein
VVPSLAEMWHMLFSTFLVHRFAWYCYWRLITMVLTSRDWRWLVAGLEGIWANCFAESTRMM